MAQEENIQQIMPLNLLKIKVSEVLIYLVGNEINIKKTGPPDKVGESFREGASPFYTTYIIAINTFTITHLFLFIVIYAMLKPSIKYTIKTAYYDSNNSDGNNGNKGVLITDFFNKKHK